jgi:ABC-type glycerol-3-phosphate transport system permease component
MGIGGRGVNSAAYAIVCLRLRFESSAVALIVTAGKKLMARIAPLFIQFRRNGIIDIYRTAMVPDVAFALLLTVVIPSFATVYTVDYGAQAAAAVVVTIPLVVLVLIFQRRVVSGLAAGVVKG